MTPREAKVAADLKSAIATKEEREKYTVRLYAVKRRRGNFGYFFFSSSDSVALNSLKELSKQIPDIQRSNLYYIGTYCTLDAKLVGVKPVLVLDK